MCILWLLLCEFIWIEHDCRVVVFHLIDTYKSWSRICHIFTVIWHLSVLCNQVWRQQNCLIFHKKTTECYKYIMLTILVTDILILGETAWGWNASSPHGTTTACRIGAPPQWRNIPSWWNHWTRNQVQRKTETSGLYISHISSQPVYHLCDSVSFEDYSSSILFWPLFSPAGSSTDTIFACAGQGSESPPVHRDVRTQCGRLLPHPDHRCRLPRIPPQNGQQVSYMEQAVVCLRQSTAFAVVLLGQVGNKVPRRNILSGNRRSVCGSFKHCEKPKAKINILHEDIRSDVLLLCADTRSNEDMDRCDFYWSRRIPGILITQWNIVIADR